MSSNIPKTCKAVVIESAGAPWAVKDVPVQEPQDGQVLIKVLACGVCHTDSAMQQGQLGPIVQFPRVPGHEMIGDVAAVGPNEKRWKVGDRVGGGWHGGHDGVCKSCARGLFQMCDNAEVNGITRNGGYAEYCLVRCEAVVSIPDDVDPAEFAPFLCAGITTFNGIRKMNIPQGDLVAVQGLGGLGHLAVQYARKMGYRVAALSTSDNKKDFAHKLGATDFINTKTTDVAQELQKLGGASLILCTAPNPEATKPLLAGCGPLGKVVILAPIGELPVDTIPMILKGISVQGWIVGNAFESQETVAFARHQDVHCMIEKFPLEKVAEAVEHMESGNVRFRAVLTMSGYQ